MKSSELPKAANREEAELLDKIDLRQLPEHLAVIMDGNGRWAQRRHLPRIAGHRTGVKTAREIIETCARLKLPCLTLYAFSLENWRRPQTEVDFLMRLLREYLKRELPSIHKNNIRLLIIGRSEQLPEAVRKDIQSAMSLTAKNTGMRLVVALNRPWLGSTGTGRAVSGGGNGSPDPTGHVCRPWRSRKSPGAIHGGSGGSTRRLHLRRWPR